MSEKIAYIDPTMPPDIGGGDMPGAIHTAEAEPRSDIARQFSAEMQQLGFQTTVLEADNNPLPDMLQSLTLVQRNDSPPERTVRLYRGVNPTGGAELAHQVGYLLKHPTYDAYGRIAETTLESPEVFQLIETFSENPTYRGLTEAVNTAEMTNSNRRFVDDRMKAVRRSLVAHPDRSLADELTFQHVAGPGSVATQDLSPFVATSRHAGYAARWGDTLMVLDVPRSQLAGLGEGAATADEVLLTGQVKPEWIAAVAELRHGVDDTDGRLKELERALGSDQPADLEACRDTLLHQKSCQNSQADRVEINKDLIGELLAVPGVDAAVLQSHLMNAGIATYRDALWQTADYYIQNIKATGRYSQVQGARQQYQYDEFSQFDYLSETPYTEWDAVRRKQQEAGVLDLAEIERLAKVSNRLTRG